ncbi:MAG: hypothetical protein LQ340_002369 [Diploschistes diacapsis]|nr:MAG: hypothetical protein LQ340_002369 [Diploschistes diacapsis]
MPDPTTYLVTGANRGIGLGLTTTLLARPNTNVIAAVRNPDTSAKVFADIEAAENSKISVIRIDASIPSDAQAAISQLRDQAELEKIDVVIANAAIADHYGPVADIKLDEVMRHFAVNVVGQIALFQATLPLLEKSENAKFVGIASLAGSIGDMEKFPMPCLAYGTSKAGLNYFLRKAHFENEKITIYALNPG